MLGSTKVIYSNFSKYSIIWNAPQTTKQIDKNYQQTDIFNFYLTRIYGPFGFETYLSSFTKINGT